MKIWLVTIGEPLPSDVGGPRLLRHGLLAEVLTARGHEVVWWTSSFDHAQMRQRAAMSAAIKVGRGLTLRLLRALGYRRSRSLARFLDHFLLARRFAREARRCPPPDLILASDPPVELCWEAVRYGRARGLPVVLDMRDAWPDLLLDLVPSWLRLPGRLILQPYFSMARASRARATAIIGVTPDFVAWGAAGVGRRPGPDDLAFPLACSDEPAPPEERLRAEKFWDAAGVRKNDGSFTVCYFGSMAGYFELDTVFEAARRFARDGKHIRFVLCGHSDDFLRHQKAIADFDNVLLPGWVGRAEIRELMARAHVGLAPYRSAWYFRMNIPNKVIEYLSASLPVVSSLQGSVEALLKESDCGLTYRNGDPGGFIAALETLQSDPARRAQMATNARERYLTSFTADTVYGQMADHLERIAAKTP